MHEGGGRGSGQFLMRVALVAVALVADRLYYESLNLLSARGSVDTVAFHLPTDGRRMSPEQLGLEPGIVHQLVAGQERSEATLAHIAVRTPKFPTEVLEAVQQNSSALRLGSPRDHLGPHALRLVGNDIGGNQCVGDLLLSRVPAKGDTGHDDCPRGPEPNRALGGQDG